MSTAIPYVNETWNPSSRFPRYEVSSNGKIRNITTKKELRLICHKSGHLYFFPKRGIKYYVHRAVLETLVGACPINNECRHLDGNPKNNYLHNLKWGTSKENANDRTQHGHRMAGENAPFSTMSNNEAAKVRILGSQGLSSRKIAKQLSVSHTTIQKILRRERYVL